MNRILFLVLLLLPGLALADDGRILYVSGKVTVERDGQLYRAVKNARIIEGDTIETGRSGRLHLRMSDRSLISLKPDTRFQIKTYRFRDAVRARPASTVAPATAGEDNRSVFGLLKGGFRAITGLIGQRNKQAFGVDTPVATIGIRGTTFVADLIEVDGPAIAAGEPLMLASNQPDLAQLDLAPREGRLKLNVGVGQGAVVVRNAYGEVVLENGEFGVVESAQRAPRRSIRPGQDNEAQPGDETPEEDEEDEQQESEESRSTGDQVVDPGDEVDEGDEEAIERKVEDDKVANRQVADNNTSPSSDFGQNAEQEADELVVPETELSDSLRDISFVSTFSGPLGRASQLQQADESASRVDPDGHLTAFAAVVGNSETGEEAGRYELIGGQVSNAGIDPDTGMHWGRWSGGTIRQTAADGTERNLSAGVAHWHLIQSAAHGPAIQLPSRGSTAYELIGNTDPSDASGNTGILGNATLNADFDNQIVNSTLALSINDQVWQASGNGSLGSGLAGDTTPAHLFSGQYDSVNVVGHGSGQGHFSGFLTNQAQGAGLSYQLQHGSETVHGAAAFSQAGN